MYDFYTSQFYLQINIFIGNNSNKTIEKYEISFQGTNNLGVFIEEKNERAIEEKMQEKERLVVEYITNGEN
jgi:hypothetical protein